MLIPNLSEALQDFCSHPAVYVLEKYSKNLSFKKIFTSKKTLVATFSEKSVPTFREYVSSKSIMMPQLLQTVQCSWFPSSLFALEKYFENLFFFLVFLPLKELLVATFCGTCAITSA